jgi:hypothetical protein
MTLTASTSTITASTNNLAASFLRPRNHSHSLWSGAKRTIFAFNMSKSKRKRSFVLENVKNRSETISISPQLVKIEAKTKFSPKYCKIERKTNCLFLNFWRSKQKRPGCSKILEEQSEAMGISPTFPKSKIKRIGLFQKFGKTKQSEVNLIKILQDRSKTNVFVPNCVKEEKQKNEASFFCEKKRRKTNIIVPQLSKICHC